MSCFGFLSPLLTSSPLSWQWVFGFLPERWRFYKGPLRTGEIIGIIFQKRIQGWGWKLPGKPVKIWDEEYRLSLWQRFLNELRNREVKVIGIEIGSSFHPSFKLLDQTVFPGVSDGKALELLFFINRFRRLLHNYEISPRRSKVLIVWEEGNLGLTCARLIAREVRFLTLVSPNLRLLERAAAIIVAETGIASQIRVDLPPDYQGANIVIKCGRITRYHLNRNSRRVIHCELFPDKPNIANINLGLPMEAVTKTGRLPLYPALGEVMLRSCFEMNRGLWYGVELPLERVLKLETLLRELGVEIRL